MTTIDLKVDAKTLCRRTQYVDEQGGMIQETMPVCVMDNRVIDDPLRQPFYDGICFMNNVPSTFRIEGAATLQQAIDGFTAACQKHVDAIEADMLRRRIAAPGKLAANRPGGPRAPR